MSPEKIAAISQLAKEIKNRVGAISQEILDFSHDFILKIRSIESDSACMN